MPSLSYLQQAEFEDFRYVRSRSAMADVMRDYLNLHTRVVVGCHAVRGYPLSPAPKGAEFAPQPSAETSPSTLTAGSPHTAISPAACANRDDQATDIHGMLGNQGHQSPRGQP